MNRIDSNQLNQLQAQAKKTNNTQKTATDGSQSSANTESAAASSDTVQISDTGRQLNEMEKSIGHPHPGPGLDLGVSSPGMSKSLIQHLDAILHW